MATIMTIRPENDLKQKPDQLTETTEQATSARTAGPIRESVELKQWQLGEIHQALREADAEEFASESLVQQIYAKRRAF